MAAGLQRQAPTEESPLSVPERDEGRRGRRRDAMTNDRVRPSSSGYRRHRCRLLSLSSRMSERDRAPFIRSSLRREPPRVPVSPSHPSP
jgi:hypothetical protein